MLDEENSEGKFRLGKSERRSRRGGETQIQSAVNGCTESWSNGMVEGFVNKVKWIKRSSYGQAGFPLLQRRVLLHPEASEPLSKDQRRRSSRKSAVPPYHDTSVAGSTPMAVAAA